MANKGNTTNGEPGLRSHLRRIGLFNWLAHDFSNSCLIDAIDSTIIDADGHVFEPPDFWQDYLDAAYRARAPQLFVDTDGQERLRIEGKVLGGPKGLGFAGAIGARQGSAPTNIRYIEGRRGGFDPHARIPDMDVDNIDAVVLYPTLGLFCGAASDPPFAAALCRAYNRWLADYCKPYPDRRATDETE